MAKKSYAVAVREYQRAQEQYVGGKRTDAQLRKVERLRKAAVRALREKWVPESNPRNNPFAKTHASRGLKKIMAHYRATQWAPYGDKGAILYSKGREVAKIRNIRDWLEDHPELFSTKENPTRSQRKRRKVVRRAIRRAAKRIRKGIRRNQGSAFLTALETAAGTVLGTQAASGVSRKRKTKNPHKKARRRVVKRATPRKRTRFNPTHAIRVRGSRRIGVGSKQQIHSAARYLRQLGVKGVQIGRARR